MNKISDNEIHNYLKNTYDKLLSIYKEEYLLGVFVTGLANYGFAKNLNDIKTITIILPTFEDLCLDLQYSTVLTEPRTKVIDIREIYGAALKHDDYSLELLFSYNYINPKYNSLFERTFVKNREQIGRLCEKTRVEKAYQRALKNIDTTYPFSPNSYNLFEACRLRASTELFLRGKPLTECFYIKEPYYINYLQKVLDGQVNVDCEKLKQDFITLIDIADEVEDDKAIALIENGIIELMTAALKIKFKQAPILNITKKEKQALKIILNEIGDEGTFSLSELITDSPISRPVFKNVLNKIKDAEFAIVENHGVSGTYVKVIDNSILDFI